MERDAICLTSREWSEICEELCIDDSTASVDLVVMKIGAIKDSLRIVRDQRDTLKWAANRTRGRGGVMR